MTLEWVIVGGRCRKKSQEDIWVRKLVELDCKEMQRGHK